MTTLTPLHDPSSGPMRIAGMMSGSGSNLRKIIEFEEEITALEGKCPYHVAVIFSDTIESKAMEIGRDHDRPVIVRDIRAFYSKRGHANRKDMTLREEFDRQTALAIEPYGCTVAALAGYMSKVTAPIYEGFLGVNVHPADLSIMNDGERKYKGDKAVRDAILSGETELRSTVHIVEKEVDKGPILMISGAVPVFVSDKFDRTDKELVRVVSDAHQTLLKQNGDLIIFPKTLLGIAQGKYAKDSEGRMYFDGQPIPNGVRL